MSQNIIFTSHFFEIAAVIRPATLLLIAALIKKHIYYNIVTVFFYFDNYILM